MRYALRNQDKIEKAYPDKIKCIIESLEDHFGHGNEVVPIESGEEYQIIIISEVGHSTNMIAFYIIEIKFDVYRLALKEFIK